MQLRDDLSDMPKVWRRYVEDRAAGAEKLTAYYNEHDPHAAAWLKNLIRAGLIASGEVDTRSITDVKPEDLRGFTQCHFFAGIGGWSAALRRAGWPDDRSVWTGSCPCQPFSSAGIEEGMEDARHLWPAWFGLIGELRPRRIFGEQVEAAIRFGWLDLVCSDLERIGYAIGASVFPAAGVGSPNIRSRCWFIAEAVGDTSSGGCGAVGGRGIDQQGDARSHADLDHEGDGAGRSWALDDPQRERLERQPWHERCRGRQPHEAGSTSEAGLLDGPGPCNGFWRDAEWLPCRDGRWRPTEPGVAPLVDGLPFRLGSGSPYEGRSRSGMLKGYGNAINVEAAAAFIMAYLEVEG